MALPGLFLMLGPISSYSSTPLVPLFGIVFAVLLIAVVVGLPVAIIARRGKE